MIRLIKPYISYKEVEADFRKIFESGIFTKGEYVNKFVKEIKSYVGSKYAFLTTSATTALTMCLKILNIQPGDEVIVSDFSFPATVNVVEDLGAKPVFADVSLDTFNMLPDELEKKITNKTKAVIFVDALGNPSGVTQIKEICDKYNVPLIEDAACAIGSSEFGKKCGNIADLTCFSLHPRKLLTTGEGGAITTNNSDFAKLLSVKLNHGAVIEDGKFEFIDYGFNYRLPELQCAMGIVQLKKLDLIVEERVLIRDVISDYISDFGFIPQKITSNVTHNIQSLVFKVPKSISRDGLITFLKDNNIETTIGTYCLSNTQYYREKYNTIQKNAKLLEENTITLPCYTDLDTDKVLSNIGNYVKKVR